MAPPHVDIQTGMLLDVLQQMLESPKVPFLDLCCFQFTLVSTSLSSNARLFANDTSLFLFDCDRNTKANELNNDLFAIRNWVYQWKMNFNIDSSKQTQEIIFSCKIKSHTIHSVLIFSNILVNQIPYQKNLGMFLHLKYITNLRG